MSRRPGEAPIKISFGVYPDGTVCYRERRGDKLITENAIDPETARWAAAELLRAAPPPDLRRWLVDEGFVLGSVVEPPTPVAA